MMIEHSNPTSEYMRLSSPDQTHNGEEWPERQPGILMGLCGVIHSYKPALVSKKR